MTILYKNRQTSIYLCLQTIGQRKNRPAFVRVSKYKHNSVSSEHILSRGLLATENFNSIRQVYDNIYVQYVL